MFELTGLECVSTLSGSPAPIMDVLERAQLAPFISRRTETGSSSNLENTLTQLGSTEFGFTRYRSYNSAIKAPFVPVKIVSTESTIL